MAEILPCGALGSFTSLAACAAAARAAQTAGMRFELYSPLPDEATLRSLVPESPSNPVRLWTLLGGIAGGLGAFAMTIWMSRDWPLVAGGKPIVSWPPFICIAFEMTVFWSALLCMSGFFVLGGVPNLTLPAAYRAEFMHDRFGLYLASPTPADTAALVTRLQQAGAVATWTIVDVARERLEEDAEARCQREAAV